MKNKMPQEEWGQFFEFLLKFRRLPEDKKMEIYYVSEGARLAAKYDEIAEGR